MEQTETLNKEEAVQTGGKGLTWRSISGILYAGVVLQPAFIWLYLQTGSIMSWAAMYTTALLFSKLTQLGKPLSKQEIFVIMYGSTVAVAEGLLFTGLIYSSYFKTSSIAARFGLTNQIPDWISPASNSPALLQRTFLHADWIAPLLVVFIATAFGIATDLALGFLTKQLYIEVEDLPFPMQKVEASVCLTLAAKESNKLKIFTFSALIAMVFATILYALPIVSYATRGESIVIIPQPWVDLSKWVGAILPGASFGIATDLTQFAIGFIIPFDVVVSMFVGSFAFYFVGNSVLVNQGLFPDWFPGMSLSTTWERSVLGFWVSPMIGLAVAAALLPILRRPGHLVRALKDLVRLPAAGKGGRVSLKVIIAVYLFGTLGSVVLVWILVPGFRFFLWILVLLSVGWSFVYTIASARSVGITGMGIPSLYVTEAAYISTGYQSADIWFAPLVVSGGGAMWCALFKVADLTETNPVEYIKAYFFAVVVAFIAGFVFVSLFWSMAPIPSSLFPCPGWPITASMQSLFMTRSLELFKPPLLLGALAVGAALFGLVEFVHLPISLIGLAIGTAFAIPFAVTYLIGALVAKLFQRRIGKEWFEANSSIIVAGLFTGTGTVIAISIAIALIAKSIWSLPY